MKRNILLKTLIFLLPVILMCNCGGNAENIIIGKAAPDFTLSDAFGNKYTLSSFRNSNPVVIYFYPKASTPGCTKQACGIRDKQDKFKDNNIIVLGISVDSKESIKDFIDENSLNFPLLSDEDKEVSKIFGVLNNIGLDSRITFIIDKTGNITNIIRDVDVDTHADDVFDLAVKLR